MCNNIEIATLATFVCWNYNRPLVEPKSNSPPLIPKYRRPSCTICYSPPANYHIVRLSLSLSNAKRRFHPILSPHLHIICFVTFMNISNANLILGNFIWRLPLHRLPNTHTQICHTWLTEQALKAVGCAFWWLSIRDGHADADYVDWCAYVHMRMRCRRQNLIAHSRPKK